MKESSCWQWPPYTNRYEEVHKNIFEQKKIQCKSYIAYRENDSRRLDNILKTLSIFIKIYIAFNIAELSACVIIAML